MKNTTLPPATQVRLNQLWLFFSKGLLLPFIALIMTAGSAKASNSLQELSAKDWQAIQQAMLAPESSNVPGDFGTSVAIFGNTVVVGAPRETVNGIYSGAAYVFIRSGDSWIQQQQLLPDPIDTDSNYARFGVSIDISANTIVIGAPSAIVNEAGVGKAYVFVRSGNNWVQEQILTSDTPTIFANFGSAVAIAGDTIVVAAAKENQDASTDSYGAAYVFERTDRVWSQQARLFEGSSTIDYYQFGSSVDISGLSIVVGAISETPNAVRFSGDAHVFTYSNNAWELQQKITPPAEVEDNARFGSAVAIVNNTLVIGAPRAIIDTAVGAGAAYTFSRADTTWSQTQRLHADTPMRNQQFGSSIAVSDAAIVIGAPYEDIDGESAVGAAYVFTRSTDSWRQEQRLQAAGNPDPYSYFGFSVATSGENSVIGSVFLQSKTQIAGNAYIFGRPTIPAAIAPVPVDHPLALAIAALFVMLMAARAIAMKKN